jgi:phage terminase small subunit
VPPADSPLDFLKAVYNDPSQDLRVRVRAAVAAAQYTHRKIGESGKKEEQQGAAEKAATGRFAASAPPKRLSH